MKARINKTQVSIVQSNWLERQAEALVVPTDPTLKLPGELLRRLNETAQQQLLERGWCDVGHAFSISLNNSGIDYLILAVPPRWGDDSARGKLANLTWEALEIAEINGASLAAIPPLGTGALGYPIEACANIMFEEIIDFTFEPLKHLRRVDICTATDAEYEAFKNEFTRQLQQLKDANDGKTHVSTTP